MQARGLHRETSKPGGDVAVPDTGTEPPFARGEHCAAAGTNMAQTLSDHRDASSGHALCALITGSSGPARAGRFAGQGPV